MTCERDVVHSLWAAKSFSAAIGFTPALVFHDDGSLSDDSCLLIEKQFPGCCMLRNADVEANSDFHKALAAFPLTSYWRLEMDVPGARKLLDVHLFSKCDYIVCLDSDVLFFRNPAEARAAIDGKLAFMCEDYQSAYTPCLRELLEVGEVIDERLNAGFVGMPRTALRLGDVERFLARHTAKPWFPWTDGWVEQTIRASLYSRIPNRRLLPRKEYSLSFDRIGESTCYHHFVGDGSRELYYSVGLRRLASSPVGTELGLAPTI